MEYPVGRVMAIEEPVPHTPLDDAIMQIEALRNRLCTIAQKLADNADRVVGFCPPVSSTGATSPVASEPNGLVERLQRQVAFLDADITHLEQAAGRNCWAV